MAISSRFITNVTRYKNSVWYVKRRANNNKRVAKLVVQQAGLEKGNYVLSIFRGNGKREIVYYDAKHKTRSVFLQRNKHAEEELQYVLRPSAEGDSWVKEVVTGHGDRITLRACNELRNSRPVRK